MKANFVILIVVATLSSQCAGFMPLKQAITSTLQTRRRLTTSAFMEHREVLQQALGSMDVFSGSAQSVMQDLHHHASSLLLSLSDGGVGEGAALDAPAAAVPKDMSDVSRYSTVDKTGFIGFFADYIEQAIDLIHKGLQGAGLHNTYGISIIIFTLLGWYFSFRSGGADAALRPISGTANHWLPHHSPSFYPPYPPSFHPALLAVKALTFPLTKTQIVSTVKMQQLTPMQEKIKARYPDKADEQTKNQMLSQLFQAAQVNPLAGCLPALAQIPIFISLYRALQNLIAENKLNEPFLWIPDLEGPTYTLPPSQSMDWIKSAFTGNPDLGWSSTLAFLSLPAILFVSQTISQKVMRPPTDPNKVLTEQEQISQGLINNLPFIVAFFSINVPAGLAVYWIVNNAMTTLITVLTKGSIVAEPVTPEVSKMMAMLEAGPGKMSMRGPRGSGKEELRTGVIMPKKAEKRDGFASGAAAQPAMGMTTNYDAAKAEGAEVSAASDVASSGGSARLVDAGGFDGDEEGQQPVEGERKRKKRVKPAQKKPKRG